MCQTDGTSTTCSGCGGREFAEFMPVGPTTIVRAVGSSQVELTMSSYLTTAFTPINACVTAFPPLASVLRIDSVVNVDGRTGEPFSEIEFYASDLPSAAIGELAQAEGVAASDAPWFAFRSHITGTVEDGVANYFVVRLTLKDGADVSAFLAELKEAGAFLTSGSDAIGIPNGDHQHFRRVGFGPIMIGQPVIFSPEDNPLPWNPGTR